MGDSDEIDANDPSVNRTKNKKNGKSKNRATKDADINNNVEENVPSTSFNMLSKTRSIEQDKIQQLEEKIQRLERVLALQELESKTNKSSTSVDNVPAEAETGTQQRTVSAKPIPVQTPGNAPPLPPPPPPEKKSLLNSPKANLFLSGLDSASKGSDDLRLSASSLIPTERSLSDHSDGEGDHSIEYNDEEPPPSYEELEKSGSLTYSQSIYRTGLKRLVIKWIML